MKRLVYVLPALAVLSVFTLYLIGSNREDTFNKSQYSTSNPSSIWVLVNKQHMLQPASYVPKDLRSVGNGQKMQSQAAEQLLKMTASAKSDGVILSAESGYRSFDMQAKAYNSIVYGFGKAKADKESARPGYSEHQTGLAMDFGSENCKVDDCFANTRASKWLTANSYKYGYILRYPNNKMEITGYKAEPWHYRYVGHALAEHLRDERGATLEEYFGVSGGINYR